MGYVLTKRDKIKNVISKWEGSYYNFRRDEWLDIRQGSSKDTYDKLLTLNLNTCSEDDVSNIIGNGSWTQIICNECIDSVERAYILVDQNGDDVGCLCKKCLKKALEELGE